MKVGDKGHLTNLFQLFIEARINHLTHEFICILLLRKAAG